MSKSKYKNRRALRRAGIAPKTRAGTEQPPWWITQWACYRPSMPNPFLEGPFAEAKEQLAGYIMVECESPERAVEIAARWPDARYFAMEVRPLMNTSGMEM